MHKSLTHYFKYVILLAISLMLASMALAAPPKTNKIQQLDGIVAVVNDSVITNSQLDLQVKLAEDQLHSAHMKMPPQAVLRKQLLQRLIDANLQIQLAKRRGIEVSNQQLNQAVARVAAQNRMTVGQFRKMVEKKGLNYPEYRKQLREELTIGQLQQRLLGKKVTITSQEVNDFIKTMGKQQKKMPEFHLKGILITLPEAPTPEQIKLARTRSNDILTKLRDGADFSTTAVAESAGKFALKGGDMGWRKAAELPPAFAKQLSASAIGGMIGPLQTPNGFYIIKLLAKRTVPVKHMTTQAHVRNIFLKAGELSMGDVSKAKLEKIRGDILNGEDFAKLAEKYSQDPNSASKGGDLGWLSISEVPPTFGVEMSKLKIGFISQPFYTNSGWEIIQVLDRRQVNDTKEYIKNQVRQLIYRRKLEQQVQNWLQQLRSESYVKVFKKEDVN